MLLSGFCCKKCCHLVCVLQIVYKGSCVNVWITNNINMPFTIFLLCKSKRTIGILYGKFTDKGDILVTNPNLHNLEDNNGLSTMSGLQPLTTGSVLKILFSVRFRNHIFYTGNNFWKKHPGYKLLRVVWG